MTLGASGAPRSGTVGDDGGGPPWATTTQRERGELVDLFFELLYIIGERAEGPGNGIGQIGGVEVDDRFAGRRMARFELHHAPWDADDR